MLRPMILALLLVVPSCSKSEPAATGGAATTSSRDPAAAKKLIGEGAVVFDVRSPDEFGAGHLPTATNLPIDQFASRLAEVEQAVGADKSKPIVVYCGTGARASKAKQTLTEAGYTNVVNGGGLDDLR